jgi:hypothetical protein
VYNAIPRDAYETDRQVDHAPASAVCPSVAWLWLSSFRLKFEGVVAG